MDLLGQIIEAVAKSTCETADNNSKYARGSGAGSGFRGSRGKPGYPIPDKLIEVESNNLKKSIEHLEDLNPTDFIRFLEKYKDLPLSGGLEISEKVDGSARISFGVDNGRIWTQSKNGVRKYSSGEYSSQHMYTAIKAGHRALESKAQDILSAWPNDIDFMVAEVLFTKIPNAIEYGPNAIIVHGAHKLNGSVISSDDLKKIVTNLTNKVGNLSDGDDTWIFEYKRIISHDDVMVDVKKEYNSIREIYDELKKLEPDRLKAVGKAPYKEALGRFKTIQLALKKKLIGQLRKQQSAYGPKGGDVEGLVFRDLESGQLIKLVDKDYFTKINKFLWYYRELLNKGVKIGDQWQIGVMEKLKATIADDVLGAPIAKTPGFVNYLKKFGENLKYPANIDTQEKRINFLLAKYIEKNNLLSGDFIGNFRNVLSNAINEFNDLKNEWDNKKKSELKLTIKDDDGKPIKTIVMDPIIKDRTDNSFKDMEDSLNGMNKALDAVGGLDGELTKRTAILKLIIGQNKLERLQGASLTNGPAEESKMTESTQQTTPHDTKKPGLFSFMKGHETEPSSGDKPLNAPKFGGKADDKLGRELISTFHNLMKTKRNLNVSSDVPSLGTGTRGTAYDIGNGQVLKITNDQNEAIASNKLKDLKFKHIVRIDDVFQFGSTPYFGILQEKLKKVSAADKEKINNSLTDTLFPVMLKLSNYDWNATTLRVLEHIREKTSVMTYKESHRYLNKVGKSWRLLVDKYQIKDMVNELKSAGIHFHDYHAGNIMLRDNGTHVLIDIGYSKVNSGKDPDILERLIREIADSLTEAKADMIGVTIGRFQPFHRGHAEIIRKLASKYTKVIVIVAGNKADKKNPFSYNTRIDLMRKSLPDVEAKLEVYKAEFEGKNSGYIPGILSDIISDHNSSIGVDTAVNVLVGPDRFEDIKMQFDRARIAKEKDSELIFDPNIAVVKLLPGVKNDDDADRVSGTKVRELLAKDDKESVKKMMDPHLVSNSSDFEEMYNRLREELKIAGLTEGNNLTEDLCDINGAAGVLDILKANTELLRKKKGISVGKARYLGKGKCGVAFDVGSNHVLKITSDQDEAVSSNLILHEGKELKFVVKIYDVFRFGNTPGIHLPVYGIIQEKLTPLSVIEKNEFSKVSDIILHNDVVGTLYKGNYEDVLNAAQEYIEQKYHINAAYAADAEDIAGDTDTADNTNTAVTAQIRKRDPKQDAKRADIVKSEMEELRNGMRKFNIDLMIADLRSLGINFADFHGDNVMKRGSTYVINDIGRSRSKGAEPPIFERIISKIVEAISSTGGTMYGTPGSHQVGARSGSSGWSAPSHNMTDDDDEGQGYWQKNLKNLQANTHITRHKAGPPKEVDERIVNVGPKKPHVGGEFENTVVEALRDQGIDAERMGSNAAAPDVHVKINGISSYVEVKMNTDAQLASPRVKYENGHWMAAGTKSSALIDAIISKLENSPDSQQFIAELGKFMFEKRKIPPSEMRIVTSSQTVSDSDPRIVSRDDMVEFLNGRHQYVMRSENENLTDIITSHYTSGKMAAADYIQIGNDFYKLGSNDPFKVPSDVPTFSAFGRLAIRIGIRSKRYEIQPEIKKKDVSSSSYSIIDKTKKFPFKKE